MCHAAVNWVISEISKREDLKPAEKWLMVILADHADRAFWSFIHGHGTLGKDAGISKRTVVTMLAKFEELGLLKRSARFREDGTRTTDLVSLLGSENPALGAIQGAINDAHHVQIATPEGAKVAQHNQGNKPGKITLGGAIAPVAGGDDVRQAFAIFNAMVEGMGGSPAKALNDDRRRRIKARLKDCGGIEAWQALIASVPESPFLRGDTHHHFQVTIDFLLQPSSFTKLVEGQYHDATRSQTDGQSPGRTGPIDRAAERAERVVGPMFAGAQAALDGGGRRRWRL